MELPERLSMIADLVARENERLKDSTLPSFFSHDTPALARSFLRALPHMKPGDHSLELGAGTGCWWLMAAAAGFPSYAIEIHPELVAVCERLRTACIQRRLIDPATPCVIACGDMIPPQWRARYRAFRTLHGEVEKSMPGVLDDQNVYQDLGIALNEFEIIYCWAWPTQSRFVFNMLEQTTREGCLFVLPAYVRYTQGEHMNASMKEVNTLIVDILAREGDVVIGKRIH